MSHLVSNDALLKRVRRLAGQIGAVERALVAGEDCATTLHIVAAVRGAVNGLLDEIVESHVREHVAHPALTEAERAAGAEQLITAIRRYSK
jgi:DNA-binding FrmR family transcriptional regulator